MWQDYLDWYRRVLALPVENNVNVTGFSLVDDLVAIETADDGSRLARKVILCTGLDGTGEWTVPRFVSEALQKAAMPIVPRISISKRLPASILVLGNGASAFDNAAMASNTAPRLSRFAFESRTFRVSTFTSGWRPAASLATSGRCRISSAGGLMPITGTSQPPPQESLWRCVNFPHFKIETNASWEKVSLNHDDAILVDTPRGRMTFDYLICGTGISNNTVTRPEIAKLSRFIATWNHVFAPQPDHADPYLGAAPYLGPGFQFLGKKKGTAPILSRIPISATARPSVWVCQPHRSVE